MKSGYYAILGLGSNLGDRVANLCEAVERIHIDCGPVIKLAPLFETDPIGGVADRAFINSAVLIFTTLSPANLLDSLLRIESALGRVREQRWDNREIDIDILMLSRKRNGTEIMRIDTESLTIPHPMFSQRAFALVPAAIICPGWHFFADVTLAQLTKRQNLRLANPKSWPNLRIITASGTRAAVVSLTLHRLHQGS